MAARSLRLNLFSSWSAHAVGLVTGIFLMPFILHTLGDASYGTWILINSVAGYAGLLYLGFGPTVSRYVALYHARGDHERLNRVVNLIFAVYLGAGVLALGVAGLLAWAAPWLHDWGGRPLAEIRWVILVLGANIFAGLAGSVFGGVLRGVQRFDLDRGVIIVSGLLRVALVVTFLSSEWGLLTLALIFLGLTLFENVVATVFAFREVEELHIDLRGVRLSTLREIRSFSGFALLEEVSVKLFDATDAVIIGCVFGAKAIVPYFIAMRLCRFIDKPVGCLSQVVMPRAGELHAQAESDDMRRLMTRSAGPAFLLTAGLFVGAGFFGDALIETWIGPGYEQSHLLLLILLGSRMVANPADIFRSVLFGAGCVRVPSLIYFAEAAANVALTVTLLPVWGLFGAAVGTAVPLVIGEAAVLLPFAFRQLDLSADRFIRDVLAPQVLPLCALLAYCFAVTATLPEPTNWPALIAISLGGGLVLALGYLLVERRERFVHVWKGLRAQTGIH